MPSRDCSRRIYENIPRNKASRNTLPARLILKSRIGETSELETKVKTLFFGIRLTQHVWFQASDT